MKKCLRNSAAALLISGCLLCPLTSCSFVSQDLPSLFHSPAGTSDQEEKFDLDSVGVRHPI